MRVVADEKSTALFPRQFPATLTAEFADGRTLTERVRDNRGGPDNPLSADELSTKFTGNADRALVPGAADDIIDAVWALRDGRPVRDALATLRRSDLYICP